MTIVVIRASIRISAITSCIVPISSPCSYSAVTQEPSLLYVTQEPSLLYVTQEPSLLCLRPPWYERGGALLLTDWLGSDIRFFYPILAADILVHHTTARVAVGAAFMVSHTTTRVHVGRSCNINTMDHCRAAESVDCPTLTPKRRCGNTFSITLISGG